MKRKQALILASLGVISACAFLPARAQRPKDLGLQLTDNPPMHTISRTPPAPPESTETFEIRDGFFLIQTLDAFRGAIKKSGQKVRMKPGVYRANTTDPAVDGHQHVFNVSGSANHFDLRGVVFETPVSVQSTLSREPHVSDSWHVFGDNNIFEGGYFRNIIDKPYPTFNATENEFEILGDGNTFKNCTFVIRGSIPYGYSDYYGKGGPNFGRLNKHSFMSIDGARNTQLFGCKIYMQSFGHCIHFHGAQGVRIEQCLIAGTLRPTNDVYKEKTGRAMEYGFNVMYRGKRPIPRDEMIPLTEDALRTYGGDKDITIIDTIVERQRGCVQLHCVGDVTLENVTVLEAGDFSFDVSSGDKGKATVKNCRADVAYNPLFNLTRGALPKDAFYEVTILSPAEGVKATPRSSLGVICGDTCTFILHDGTTRPLPPKANQLTCGGKKKLIHSTVTNYTTARLILNKNVTDCIIKSVGPVEDRGKNNTIVKIKPKATPKN